MDLASVPQEDYSALQAIRDKVTGQLTELDRRGKLRDWEERRVQELRRQAAADRTRAYAMKAKDISFLCSDALSRCDAVMNSLRRPSQNSLRMSTELRGAQRSYFEAVRRMSGRWEALAKQRLERRLHEYRAATATMEKTTALKVQQEKARRQWQQQLNDEHIAYHTALRDRFSAENQIRTERLRAELQKDRLREEALKIGYERDTERARGLAETHVDEAAVTMRGQAEEFAKLPPVSRLASPRAMPQGMSEPHARAALVATAQEEAQRQARMRDTIARQNQYIEELKKAAMGGTGGAGSASRSQQHQERVSRPMPAANLKSIDGGTVLPPKRGYDYWERLGNVVTSEQRGLLPRSRLPAQAMSDPASPPPEQHSFATAPASARRGGRPQAGLSRVLSQSAAPTAVRRGLGGHVAMRSQQTMSQQTMSQQAMSQQAMSQQTMSQQTMPKPQTKPAVQRTVSPDGIEEIQVQNFGTDAAAGTTNTAEASGTADTADQPQPGTGDDEKHDDLHDALQDTRMEKPVVGQPVVEQLTDSAGPMGDGMRDGLRDGIPPWTRDMGAPTGDGASRPVETKESPRPNAGMNAVGATNATNTTAKDAVQAQVPATSDGASDFDLLDGDSGSAGTGGFGISGIGGFSPAPSEKSGERGSGGGGDGPGLGVLGGSLGGSTLGFVSRSPKQNEIKKSADSSSAAQDGVATAANVTPKFGTGVGFKAASAGRVTMRADSRPKKSESGPKKSEEESEAEARAAVDEAQRKLEAEMAGAAGAATGGAVGDGEWEPPKTRSTRSRGRRNLIMSGSDAGTGVDASIQSPSTTGTATRRTEGGGARKTAIADTASGDGDFDLGIDADDLMDSVDGDSEFGGGGLDMSGTLDAAGTLQDDDFDD